ncbi:3'-5' exonuclease [Halalkalibacterium ligniniphilum]|uniref:3'-5' exonuclease n=1 Tax=Halalkalibacterium ligniniphilum TaxID=1134413 RepID=UPI00034AC561|nr:3'-5' exonuclease [Halalkalibacterium ligniniphilum]
MVMNHMVQLMKQLSTKLSPTIYTSAQQQSSAQQLSYMRQLQRELKREDVLDIPLAKLPVVVFDLETSGFYPDKGDRILSIGAVKVTGEMIQEDQFFYSCVRSEQLPSAEILALTGLKKEELEEAPPLGEVLQQFYRFVRHSTLVAHHASHEKAFMSHATWQTLKLPFQHRIIDTSFLTKVVAPKETLVSLDDCCAYYGIPVADRHHALHDSLMTAKLWKASISEVQQAGYETLRDIYLFLAKGRTTRI